ncbi:PadR family transcriptional regulator [Cytobacillus sp. Hm23]|uniref:PadR family transcriptional regulator n=1 Tax=Cytobacillus sp. IB215665 TaxID=3097357 RepID=UPI002A103A13|nr:PadR family transcriptional regulator [Cytobacillus sp. IB215665]MDX8365553.1 PadR family transcriptional regulator [Cytobacillus sp. IB215665]
MNKEILKGSIDILILSIIAKHDTYGYQIAKKIKANSSNSYVIGEGTLYPALKRLEKKNFISSYWGESDSAGRRKYYKLTDDGRTELSKKIADWKEANDLINLSTEGLN